MLANEMDMHNLSMHNLSLISGSCARSFSLQALSQATFQTIYTVQHGPT